MVTVPDADGEIVPEKVAVFPDVTLADEDCKVMVGVVGWTV
jgi:hypothetical protein